MTLPAWDSIVGDDRWRGLTDQHRKTVFQKYLGDIGQLKEWQTLNDDQKEEVTRKMEVDAGFYEEPFKPHPGMQPLLRTAEDVEKIAGKIAEAAPDPYREITEEERTTREGWPLKREPLTPRSQYRGVQKIDTAPPPTKGLDAPQVGDSYFLHEKQVIDDELGGSSEIGPGWVTPWSKLKPDARKQDVEEVVTGKGKDFGEISRYINQLHREYGDYGKAADELVNMIDRGLLPDFYMTISDRPFKDQLEQFERIQTSQGGLPEGMEAMPERVGRIEAARGAEAFPGRQPPGSTEALSEHYADRPTFEDVEVGDPLVGLHYLFKPFEPAEAYYTMPFPEQAVAVPEAHDAQIPEEHRESAEYSLEQVMGEAGKVAAKLFPGGPDPESPWTEHSLNPPFAAEIAKQVGRFGILYPVYARIFARTMYGLASAMNRASNTYKATGSFRGWSHAHRAAKAFTEESGRAFTLERMMQRRASFESGELRMGKFSEEEALKAARMFERDFGYRSKFDPRGTAPEGVATEPVFDPVSGEAEVKELPQLSLAKDDIPDIRTMYQKGELSSGTIEIFKQQNPNLAFDLDDIINEGIIARAAEGEMPGEVKGAEEIGEEIEAEGEEVISAEQEEAERLHLRRVTSDRLETTAGEEVGEGLGLTDVVEPPIDRRLAGIDDAGNFTVGLPTEAKSFSELDIPSRQSVMSDVLSVLHDDQVFNSVVSRIPVDMMNDLGGKEFSAEVLRHDKSMFLNALATNRDSSVAARIIQFLADNPAPLAAEVVGRPDLTLGAKKDLAAIAAGEPSPVGFPADIPFSHVETPSEKIIPETAEEAKRTPEQIEEAKRKVMDVAGDEITEKEPLRVETREDIREAMEEPEQWIPTTKPEMERIEGSFQREITTFKDLMRDKDYPKKPERERLEITKDHKYVYHSGNRPLSYLLIRSDMPDVILPESGRYIFSKEPVSMEQIYRWELTAVGKETRGALALDYYRSVHPDAKGVELYRELPEGRGWQGVVISESAKEPGRWQATTFDERGFSGDSSHKTEIEAVGEALFDGYLQPMPGLLDDAVAAPEFLEGIRTVEEFHKKQQESMERAKKEPHELTPEEYLEHVKERGSEIKYTREVITEEGVTAKMTKEAGAALQEIEAETDAYQKILDCLGVK